MEQISAIRRISASDIQWGAGGLGGRADGTES